MAAFGPATLSIIAGRIFSSRFLEHVSKRAGGVTGLIVGLLVVFLPLLHLEFFLRIWWTENWVQFNLVTAVINGVAVATTCAVCLGINHYRKERIWYGRR